MTLQEQFDAYDAANPNTWALFCTLVKERIEAGAVKTSAQMVLERMRWEHYGLPKMDGFKVNNNYASFYARKWLRENPDYPNMFQLRVSNVA